MLLRQLFDQAVRLRFQGQAYATEPRETVLACLERHGVEVASFCRSGSCQTCLLRATTGAPPAAAQAGLKEEWKRQGLFLACLCRPTEDLEIERANVLGIYAAEVLDVEPLTVSTFRVWLSRPRGFIHEAGQFVQVVRPMDGLMRPYSLSSLPGHELELHIKGLPGGKMSSWLARSKGQVVGIRGPLGNCVYRPEHAKRPLLLAGNSTGLSPLLGVARAALAAGHAAPIRLFHGSKTANGLYLQTELSALQQAAPSLEIALSLLDDPASGRSNRALPTVNVPLEQLVLSRPDLVDHSAFLSGCPALVARLTARLLAAGLPEAQLRADPFLPPGRAVPLATRRDP